MRQKRNKPLVLVPIEVPDAILVESLERGGTRCRTRTAWRKGDDRGCLSRTDQAPKR